VFSSLTQTNPSSIANMDITNILNSKGAAAAAAGPSPEQQLHQHLAAHAHGHPMSENASDRGNSPHGSEHSSRYSGPGMSQVNGMGSGMRYPSPTGMQTSLPMLQGYPPQNAFDGGMMQQDARTSGRQPSGENTAQKAFPCSSCGKGFARRSDLARHGRSSFSLKKPPMPAQPD